MMKKALTLVEAMVASLIFGLIAAMMLVFLVQGAGLWNLVTISSDLRSTGRATMNEMRSELGRATNTSSAFPSPNITVPNPPNNISITFCLPVDTDGNGTIVDAFGNTEWDTTNKVTYQYNAATQQITRSRAGQQKVLANNVAVARFFSPSFEPTLSNNEVRVNFTLERNTSQNRTISVPLASIIKLRN